MRTISAWVVCSLALCSIPIKMYFRKSYRIHCLLIGRLSLKSTCNPVRNRVIVRHFDFEKLHKRHCRSLSMRTSLLDGLSFQTRLGYQTSLAFLRRILKLVRVFLVQNGFDLEMRTFCFVGLLTFVTSTHSQSFLKYLCRESMSYSIRWNV